MKSTSLFFPILLILLSTYSICSCQSSEAVVDMDGDILTISQQYYILPGFRGMGGGVTLGSTSNESCPLDVIQAELEIDNGNLPMSFSHVGPRIGFIVESTDLTVRFNGATICIQSLFWRLEEREGEYVVTTGGSDESRGLFKIEKYLNNYKIRYCPTVCDTCKPICGDIGISIKDGYRRLVISDEPFMVKFLKANTEEDVSA